MTYTTPGPHQEARVVNLAKPDGVYPVLDPETAMACLADLQSKDPDGRFEVQRREVWVEVWEHYAGEHPR